MALFAKVETLYSINMPMFPADGVPIEHLYSTRMLWRICTKRGELRCCYVICLSTGLHH